VEKAFKLRIGDLCSSLLTIGIVHMNEKVCPSMSMVKTPLLMKKIGCNVIDETFLVSS
jgi:hypothetical protein